MKGRSRPTFTPEFRLEAAQLVVDQGYSMREAAQAMNVGLSTMNKWAQQLKKERQGVVGKATPLTPDRARSENLRNGSNV